MSRYFNVKSKIKVSYHYLPDIKEKVQKKKTIFFCHNLFSFFSRLRDNNIKRLLILMYYNGK